MSERTKEAQRYFKALREQETPEQAKERVQLEQQFFELFGERLGGGIVLGYPRPWTAEYRDLLRRTVEAKDIAVWDAWLDQYPKDGTVE